VVKFNAPGLDVPPGVRRKFTRRITLDGLRLKVELLGALWLKAPFYGIMVSTPDHQHASYMIRRPYARCGAKEYKALLARVHTAPCSRPRCGRRCLADDPGNPDALCRPHWTAQLKKDVAREQKEAAERMARDDRRARARGAKFRAILWLHRNGDDVYIVRYFKTKPGDVELRRIALRMRSKILDDFSVAKL
jgi:hypothetical protein